MPAWLIDLFGSRQLNQTFWVLTLAPLPVWFALVFYPRHRITRFLAGPGLFPPLLSLMYLYLIWQAWEVGPPRLPGDVAARSTRVFLFHPIIFLVLWAHLQMANLFVAHYLLREARARRMKIPLEIGLCWILAPVAVLVYGLHRLIRFRFTRRRARERRS